MRERHRTQGRRDAPGAGQDFVVRVEKMGERGMAVSHLPDGMALLVPYAAPGDVARIRLQHRTSSLAQGRIVELLQSSSDRVPPPCPYFGSCGGCSLQHIRYDRQLEYKRQILAGVYRDLDVRVEPVEPSPQTYAYRNKLQMQTADEGGWLVAGFYRVKSHDIVPVERCLLQSDAANGLAQDTVKTLSRRGVRPWGAGTRGGEVRDLVIRESNTKGELTLTIVSGVPRLRGEDALSRELFARHPGLKGLYLYHNPHRTEYVFRDGEHPGRDSRGSPLRKIHGRSLVETFAGLEMETTPVTFFQVNTGVAERVVERVRSILGATRRSVLVDAYAGVGALSLSVAAQFGRIVAIESVRQSCELARSNAKRNGVSGYRVLHGQATSLLEQVLTSRPPEGAERDGVILMDPPRTGLEERAARLIARSGYPLFLYLSCDPRTQARDLALIVSSGPYRVCEIRPFDMFPQTHHVECLAVLERLSR